MCVCVRACVLCVCACVDEGDGVCVHGVGEMAGVGIGCLECGGGGGCIWSGCVGVLCICSVCG